MELIIDNRENSLIKLLQKHNFHFTSSNLDIGDIQYKHNNQLIYIIERKTINDLGASIKDGRYKEQKSRILSHNNNNNVFYILEGNINYCETLSTKAILGSIVNMLFRDQIKIIYSRDIQQTLDIIIQIKTKFDSNKFISNQNITQNDYISCIKMNKKENLDKKTCHIIQLATIPGVSKNIATIILDKYQSIHNLIKLFESHDELLLSDLQLGKKKLGKVLSKKIYDFLL